MSELNEYDISGEFYANMMAKLAEAQSIRDNIINGAKKVNILKSAQTDETELSTELTSEANKAASSHVEQTVVALTAEPTSNASGHVNSIDTSEPTSVASNAASRVQVNESITSELTQVVNTASQGHVKSTSELHKVLSSYLSKYHL